MTRKTGIPGRRRAVPPSSPFIPEPPQTCDGFVYTVQAGDSLHTIAKKFNCSLKQLLKANPQLGTRSGHLFIRQKICIPDSIEILPSTKLLPLGPRVLFVELLDAMGNPLPVLNGFVRLAPRAFIRVIFSEPVVQAFFFFAPSGRLVFKPSLLVGLETVSPPQRSIRFIWNVPAGIRGSLFIVGCNEAVCGPAEEILVTRL